MTVDTFHFGVFTAKRVARDFMLEIVDLPFRVRMALRAISALEFLRKILIVEASVAGQTLRLFELRPLIHERFAQVRWRARRIHFRARSIGLGRAVTVRTLKFGVFTDEFVASVA